MQKKICKPNEFTMPTDAEIMQDVEEMFEFLKLTHPYMEDRKELIKKYPPWETDGATAPADVVLEIRALKRSPEDVESFYRLEDGCEFGQSLKLYDLQEKSKRRLFTYLKEKYRRCIENNTYFCLYYSVFCYNDEIMRMNENTGKVLEYKNKRFNCAAKNNVAWTQILVADFDKLDESEFIEYRKRLEDIGLGEALILMSGHGYQMVWLLDDITIEKNVLERMTETLISRGFRVDGNIKDCARIMRLIASWNCKGMSRAFKKLEEELIRVEWLRKTSKRYNINYIFDALESLEIQDTEYYKVFLKNKEKDRRKKKSKDEQQVKKNNIEEAPGEDVPLEVKADVPKVEIQKEKFRDEINVNELQKIYKTLDIESLEIPIQRMLLGYREHYANDVTYFLVQILKIMGYSKNVIVENIKILSRQDRYNYPWNWDENKAEIKRIINTAWDSQATPVKLYTEKLTAFGYIDFKTYFKIIIRDRIKINNSVFEELPNIDATEFYVYMRLLVHYNRFGEKEFTMQDIIKICGLSKNTVIRAVNKLLKNDRDDKENPNGRLNLLYRKEDAYSTKLRDKHIYSINHLFEESQYFTAFNVYVVDGLCDKVQMKKINSRQLTFLLYLRYKVYLGYESIEISQSEIGADLGVTRSAVSKLLKPLEEQGLIKLNEIKFDNYKFIYEYILQ